MKDLLDDEVVAMLAERGVEGVRLSAEEHRDWESGWRAVYGHLIESGRGGLVGAAAVEAYRRERGMEWVVVPFLSRAAGKGVGRGRDLRGAYQCEGPVVELRDFYGGEFFVSPIDLGWTFVVMGGGPYFLRS